MRGDETLLDIGCGPGLLAIGFAPFLGSCTGLDAESAMIEAAKVAAAEAGVALSLIHGRIEEFPTTQTYDDITIGRALHWLERSATLAVLEQILAPESGRILICRASSTETPETPWVKSYEQVRRAWASGPEEKHYRIDPKEWFADSCFRALGETSVAERRQVTVADLIGRALSKSNSSPEIIGKERARFEEEITATRSTRSRWSLGGASSSPSDDVRSPAVRRPALLRQLNEPSRPAASPLLTPFPVNHPSFVQRTISRQSVAPAHGVVMADRIAGLRMSACCWILFSNVILNRINQHFELL